MSDKIERGIIVIPNKGNTFTIINTIHHVLIGENLTCDDMNLLLDKATAFMTQELEKENAQQKPSV